jgi:sucrose phosphorylase
MKSKLKRPVVQKLLNLLKFRNTAQAFDLDGGIEIETPSETDIVITRFDAARESVAVLTANAKSYTFEITLNGEKMTLL